VPYNLILSHYFDSGVYKSNRGITQFISKEVLLRRSFFIIPLLSVCLSQGVLAQDLQRLKITPIDLYNEGNIYPHWVDSITNDGNRIYTSTVQDPFILVLEPDGRVVKTIGREGKGPGEFSDGIVAMSVYKDHVLALATPRDQLSHFVSGEYVGVVKIKPVAHLSVHTHTANTFAFFEDTAVFQAFPGTAIWGLLIM